MERSRACSCRDRIGIRGNDTAAIEHDEPSGNLRGDRRERDVLLLRAKACGKQKAVKKDKDSGHLTGSRAVAAAEECIGMKRWG